MSQVLLHPDRLFPTDSAARQLARELYVQVRDLPIISPHGHTDPVWFADNQNFVDAVSLLLTPDHYVLRMLYSQGISLEHIEDPREAWRIFAKTFYLFRATPSSLWFKHVFYEIFGLTEEFGPSSADRSFDCINEKLASPEYKPRALYERFKIEVLATTDAPIDSLTAHQKIAKEWGKRIIPTYRPDSVIDPENPKFFENLKSLGKITDQDTGTLSGYLQAHEIRREFFKSLGATATDHGHPSARTLVLNKFEAETLFAKIMSRNFLPQDADDFRAYMLTEMARMSLEDGLVMQLHPGSFRNHNQKLFALYGPDKGADIPVMGEYTRNLKPLLDVYGNERNFSLILFTLDESTYSRELAPLAGHYPAVKLGPPWWFHDSPEGMIRFRQQTTETAGFYNTAGFNDDTRAFLSIPARHDLARRIDCRILAEWVCEHRISISEAREIIQDLSHRLVKKAYRL